MVSTLNTPKIVSQNWMLSLKPDVFPWISLVFYNFLHFFLVQEASHSDPCAESLEHHTVPPRRARGMLQPPRRRWQRGTRCCPGGGCQGTWWENTRKSGVVRCVHLRFLFICDILVFSFCVHIYIYMCVRIISTFNNNYKSLYIYI